MVYVTMHSPFFIEIFYWGHAKRYSSISLSVSLHLWSCLGISAPPSPIQKFRFFRVFPPILNNLSVSGVSTSFPRCLRIAAGRILHMPQATLLDAAVPKQCPD